MFIGLGLASNLGLVIGLSGSVLERGSGPLAGLWLVLDLWEFGFWAMG